MQNNRKLKIRKTSVYSKLEPQQHQIVFFTYAEKEPWIKKISEYHKMHRNHLGYFQLNTTILVVIFQHFLIIQLTSESPQVKQYLISNITNLVHELPHELPNYLRLRILGNQETLEICQMWAQTQPNAQSSFQKLNVDNSCQRTCKIRYYIFEVLPSFIVSLYFVPNILSRIAIIAII